MLQKAFQSECIPYSETGKFSKIILDYISDSPTLREFYKIPVSIEGIQQAIESRKKFPTDRKLLVEGLQKQYEGINSGDRVFANLTLLQDINTFTICTAHQPNILTGHLYFVYKILHAVKLCRHLKQELPQYNFVPVFFMGSEDADLAELNHIVVDQKRYEWKTGQHGAVGRMKVDKELIQLIDALEGRLAIEKYGSEIIALIRECYQINFTIEHSTFLFVHQLFKDFGLVIFLPDTPFFKKPMIPVFEQDLFSHISSEVVIETSHKLSKAYNVQATPREINLFYLSDGIRNRIVQNGEKFSVNQTALSFTKEQLLDELQHHPEHFSPNVILRGLMQEILLPDIAFVGGGGEVAYWLQLKGLFEKFKVPFPMLVLRNSFLIIEKKYANLLKKLNLQPQDIFNTEEQVLTNIVRVHSMHDLSLTTEKKDMATLYNLILQKVTQIDSTLQKHILALQKKQQGLLSALEKKLLRAEKRKFHAQKNQLRKIFAELFPSGGLQERSENFTTYYAKWGSTFFELICQHSLTLEERFCILTES